MPQSHKLEGFVYNAAGNPQADRIVRAYRRDYGTLIGEATTGNGTVVTADEYFSNVSLLLNFDGVNNATSTFDLSPTPKTVTFNGNAKLSNVEKKFGETSCYFDGAGDYLSIPSNVGFDFGTSDFTCEFWFNPSIINGTIQDMVTRQPDGAVGLAFQIRTSTTNKLEAIFRADGSGTAYGLTGTTTLVSNTWYHAAVCRKDGTFLLLLNGILEATLTQIIILNGVASLLIGCIGEGTKDAFYNGYIDDLRITKGVARYGVFNQPTTEIPEISPMFLDVKGNILLGSGGAILSPIQKKFGSVSAYFNGTGGHLSHTSPNLGTYDFTVEGWIYVTTPSSAFILWDQRKADTDAYGFVFYVRSTSKLTFGRSTTGSDYITTEGATSIVANTWYHVALARSNGVVKGFLNGVEEFSVSDSRNLTTTSVKIGHQWNAVGTLSAGYVQGIRLTKDWARYTKSFNPPKHSVIDNTPYSDAYDANTTLNLSLKGFEEDVFWDRVVLMLGMDGPAGGTTFYDATGKTITKYGNVALSTAQKKFPGGCSAYFGGTFTTNGEHLTIPKTTELDFGSGDFTIEAWVYPVSLANYLVIFGTGLNAAPNYSLALIVSSSGAVSLSASTNSGSSPNNSAFTAAGTVTTGMWYHLAGTRVGSTLLVHVNGVLSASGSISGSIYHNAAEPATVGVSFTSASSASLRIYSHMYLDELRVTKGVGRYGGNFTVPDAPFFGFNDTKGKDISILGDTKLTSASRYFGWGSAYFDGTGDYLSIPSSVDFDFGAGDFTIECWINVAVLPSVIWGLVSRRATTALYAPFDIEVLPSGALKCQVSTDGVSWITAQTSTLLAALTWNHIAFTRFGSTLRVFINGSESASAVVSGSLIASSAPLAIGSTDSSNQYGFQGYLQDLRVTKGIARYTGSFTAPQKPFNFSGSDYFEEHNLLLMPLEDQRTSSSDPYRDNVVLNMRMNGKPDNGDAYKDYTVLNMRLDGVNGTKFFSDDCGKVVTPSGGVVLSSKNKKSGNTSAYFNGTDSYLSVPDSTDVEFGSGNFTIELWVYKEAAGTGFILNKGGNQNVTYPAVDFLLGDTSGAFRVSSSSAGANFTSLTFTGISLMQWNHIAIVRDGNTLKAFINGIKLGEVTYTVSVYDSATPLEIGRYQLSGDTYLAFNGYIDDLRITKGIARYSANFTPASSIPRISPTPLIYDEAGNPITVVGDTRLSSTVKKFGVSSCYFDGTGDKLTIPDSSGLYLESSSFTIEAWINVPSFSGVRQIVGQWYSSGSTAWTFYTYTEGLLGFDWSDSGSWAAGRSITSPNGSLVVNTWTHVAVSRSGSKQYLFINGKVVATRTAAITTVFNATNNIEIGGNQASQMFVGYIEDLRITKGVARYTADFTPPAQAHPSTEYSGNALGKFTIPTSFTGETYVVVLPHETEITNAKIKDRIVPVAI